MTKADNIKKKIEQLNFKSTPAMRSRILSQATQAMEVTLNAQAEKPSFRRMITNNKIKFAVAAILIIAVLIGIKQFGGSFDLANPAYALSDVPKSIIEARTIHIQGWFGSDTEGGIRRSRT